MPFYIVCDVSGSMAGDIGELNTALAQLRTEIMSDPVVDDLTMLSVISFDTTARTVAPPSEVQLPRGRWFVARTNNVSELLKSMTSAIGKTVISSGLSAGSGTAQIMPTTVPSSTGMQFGEAGDTV